MWLSSEAMTHIRVLNSILLMMYCNGRKALFEPDDHMTGLIHMRELKMLPVKLEYRRLICLAGEIFSDSQHF